jgi:hypothetical protein
VLLQIYVGTGPDFLVIDHLCRSNEYLATTRDVLAVTA